MYEDSGIIIEKKIQQIKSFLDGTLTSEEEKVFREWLDESPANRELLRRVQDERFLLEKLRFRARNDKEIAWKKIQLRIHKKPLNFIRFVRYAAVIVVFVCVGFIIREFALAGTEEENQEVAVAVPIKGGYKACLKLANGEHYVLDSLSEITAQVDGVVIRSGEKGTIMVSEQSSDIMEDHVEYNRIEVPKGGEYKLLLADGTQVWINSSSNFEFPSRFSGKERRVRLSGEAYFEVTKDAEKPFIVEVGDKNVQVLGTSFNINDYNGSFTTTLVTGRVEVHVGQQDYILDPSMQIKVENENVTLAKVDTREFVSWKDGLFVFKNQCLHEALNTLSRWYDVDVCYEDQELQDLHFSGTIKRHAEIIEVLKFLERTDMVKFTLNGKTLIVSK